MSESYLCHHCNNYPNLSFKVGDVVEIDSDIDNDEPEESHIHEGAISKIKPKNKEITVKLYNNEICSYFWDEIHIQRTKTSSLCDMTEFQQQLLEKDKLISNIKSNLQKQLIINDQNKTQLEEKDKLIKHGSKKEEQTVKKYELLVKKLQNTIAANDKSISEKDEAMDNLQSLFTDIQTQKNEQIKQEQNGKNKYKRIAEEEQTNRMTQKKKYEKIIKEKDEIINDNMNVLSQAMENEQQKRLYKDKEYQLKYQQLMSDFTEMKSNFNQMKNEFEDQKNVENQLMKQLKTEKQNNLLLQMKYENYEQIKSELFNTQVKLVEETRNKEKYKKKIDEYRKATTTQLKHVKKLYQEREEEKKDHELIVETVLEQNESERLQKETERHKKEQVMEKAIEQEKQYEINLKQEKKENMKLIEEKKNLLELNKQLENVIEEEKKQKLQKEEEYKELRGKLEKFDVRYPEFWDEKYMIEENYAKPKLIDMTTNGMHPMAQEVKNRFFLTVDANQYEIIKIEGVQNQMLFDKHWNEKQTMIKAIGRDKLNVRHVFHGTKSEQVMTFVEKEGFRKEFNRAAAYGFGTYLAVNANYSVGYSSCVNGIYKMFQCMAICGESHLGGNYQLNAWPKKASGLIYDSLANNVANPSIFVIHNDVRIYPMFVIHFRRK